MDEGYEEAQELLVKASETLLMQVELGYLHYCLGKEYPDVVEDYLPNIKHAETFKKYVRLGRTYLPKDR